MDERLTPDLGRWRQPSLLAAIGVGLFVLFTPLPAVSPPPVVPTNAMARHALDTAALLGARTPSRRPFAPAHGPSRSTPAEQGGGEASVRNPAEPAARPLEPPLQPAELGALASHAKTMTMITAEDASFIDRMLAELRNRGAAAVPAIGDFLRRGEDVDFSALRGSDLVGYRTLREALIDCLRKIGGEEARAVALEQLQRTREPIEISMLARNLDDEEPTVHREAVIQAIDTTLKSAEQASESVDVGPLFDLLRAYGGKEAIAVLEQSLPQWREYALIALAGLPDGEGIPSLAAFAAGADDRVLPLQALAQATIDHPDAGATLVDVARAARVADQDWRAMGEALAGKQLRFSRRMFDRTPLADGAASPAGRPSPSRTYYIQWLNVRYEQDAVSAEWSPEKVERQLALIDDLLEVAPSPAAAAALQQARTSLEQPRT